MILNISHETVYAYDQPVSFGLQQVRQTPRTSHVQRVLEWETHVEGGTTQASFSDHYNNAVQLVSLSEGQNTFRLVSSGSVETSDTGGVFGAASELVPLWLFLRSTPLTHAGPLVEQLVRGVRADPGDLSALHELSARVRETVRYETGSSTTWSTAEDALESGAGVCQDHAHVFVTAARLAGWPARYVSGYLMMNDRIDQEASHAWAEAHVAGLGWVGFDVSNGISPDERYVRIAIGLDYGEAAPVSGIRFGTAREELDVSIQVQQ
ncbi:MAG: transglutaminase family protein [Acidimicrobiales bacterium]